MCCRCQSALRRNRRAMAGRRTSAFKSISKCQTAGAQIERGEECGEQRRHRHAQPPLIAVEQSEDQRRGDEGECRGAAAQDDQERQIEAEEYLLADPGIDGQRHDAEQLGPVARQHRGDVQPGHGLDGFAPPALQQRAQRSPAEQCPDHEPEDQRAVDAKVGHCRGQRGELAGEAPQRLHPPEQRQPEQRHAQIHGAGVAGPAQEGALAPLRVLDRAETPEAADVAALEPGERGQRCDQQRRRNERMHVLPPL